MSLKGEGLSGCMLTSILAGGVVGSLTDAARSDDSF